MENEISKSLTNLLKELVNKTNAPISKYQNLIKTNPLINGEFSFCGIEKKDYDEIRDRMKKIALDLIDLTDFTYEKNNNSDVDKITSEFLSGERDINELFESIKNIENN